jgi:hypothetical protein
MVRSLVEIFSVFTYLASRRPLLLWADKLISFRDADDKFRRHGGLSIRRVPRLREVLQFQERLADDMQEDEWFSNRLSLLPKANGANVTIAKSFAVRDVWHEWPLGYSVRDDLHPDNSKDMWASQERRKQIFEYCPELRIIMKMRMQRERCRYSSCPVSVLSLERTDHALVEVGNVY